MQKIYSRINWENFPSEKTAVNESNLNKMDLAIDNLDDRVVAMDAAKFNTETANTLIKDWVIDEQTGVITITKLNGEKILFDLNIEKIPVNFTLSDDGIITMTTDDGEQFTANIGAMIPILTFEDSDEIAVSVSGEGVNKTYSFSVKNGSITEEKLNPTYLGEIHTQVARAESSATSADASEKNAASSSALSKSYAVGGTGTRDGEDTDNAKYYAEQAKNASDVGALSEIVENHISDKIVHMTESEHDVVSKLGESLEGSLTYNGSEIKPSVATTESTGVVKPDGKSISVDESGTLRINLDGTTITLDEAKNVIKLADALKDKIGSALQPESIVNNQVTTETGFALDARQANPNIDGSLAKQISDLNGSLKKIELTRHNVEGINTSDVQCFVKNNIAYVYIAITYNPKEAITGWTNIVGNLPIPAYNGNLFVIWESVKNDTYIGSMITKGGDLMIIGQTVSSIKNIFKVISYPIA